MEYCTYGKEPLLCVHTRGGDCRATVAQLYGCPLNDTEDRKAVLAAQFEEQAAAARHASDRHAQRLLQGRKKR